jgi:hypothetical protein
MRIAFFLLALFVDGLSAGTPDAIDLMKRSASAFEDNRQRASNYLYRERLTYRQFDKKSALIHEDSRTFEIVYLEGETYHKLVARNGKPLSATELQAEDVKMQHEAERRRGKALDARLAERVPSRDRAQIAYQRIPELHRVRLAGEEIYNNRPVWILTAEPNPEVRPESEIDNYTHSLRFRLWIDQQSLLFHRVEAMSLRAAWNRPAGNRLEIEFVPFDSFVWLVNRVYQRAPLGRESRPATRQDTEQIYSDFRRFQADSKMVPLEQEPGNQRKQN